MKESVAGHTWILAKVVRMSLSSQMWVSSDMAAVEEVRRSRFRDTSLDTIKHQYSEMTRNGLWSVDCSSAKLSISGCAELWQILQCALRWILTITNADMPAGRPLIWGCLNHSTKKMEGIGRWWFSAGDVMNSGKSGFQTAGIPVSSCRLYVIFRTKPVYYPQNLPPSHTGAAAATVLQGQNETPEHDLHVNHATGNNLAPGKGDGQY